ncbi:hypothetical protein OESDEN_01634 [Oesophagostomum dentatum]|uniref:Peptidase A2 domain-containing protein n=1 Tax=Oesophagostomum dentatum TaxID=61180 RepID=A0A0B1TM83_OESDE|nr:hypothetical protein OESDEN_01634 [Oesophagostomum dentatum]
MTATALAFSMESMDYELVTVSFDTGAQKSFINSERNASLQLPTARNTSSTMNGFGGRIENFVFSEVSLTLKNPTSGKKIRVAQPTLEDRLITPDILVGQDLIDSFLLRDQPCVTLPSGLVLTPTVFGFAISGRSSIRGLKAPEMHSENGAVLVATPVLSHAREEYKQDIKNLYELASLGIKLEKNSEEESVLRFMTKYRSSIKIENGKITAGFPFMDNVGHLKDNFKVATKRLQSLLRILQQDRRKCLCTTML